MSQLLKSLYAWGPNAFGELGLGDQTARLSPTLVGNSGEWQYVRGGQEFSLAIKPNGTMWAWGSNAGAKTGVGTDQGVTLTPTQIGTESNWVKVAAGNATSYALNSLGELYSWGASFQSGQPIASRPGTIFTPTKIGTANNWIFIDASNSGVFAINNLGQLWAWGSNDQGSLGLGSEILRFEEPTRVGSASNWVSVNAGNFNGAAINSLGELYVWGSNSVNQLGTGDATDKFVPTRLGSASNWTQVTLATGHGLAINSQGELYSWGFNSVGATGQNTTVGNTAVPTRVGTASDWIAIATNGQSSFAINNQGQLWAWGFNGSGGQLGLGDTNNRIVPTLVNNNTPEEPWSEMLDGFNHRLIFKVSPPVIVSLFAVSNLSAEAEKIKLASVNLTSNSELQITAISTKEFNAALNANFVLTANAQRILEDDTYFETGYIENGYFVTNFNNSADLISNFTVSLQTTRIKNADVTLVAEAEVIVTAGKLVDTGAVLQSEFSQSTTISHINGADLFAFAEAQLAAQVDRITDNNIVADSIFDVAVDFVKLVQASIAADAQATVDAQVQKFRDAVSLQEAAFSIIVSGGKAITADASLASEFNINIETEVVNDGKSDMVSETAISTTANKNVDAVITLDSTTTKFVIAVTIANKEIDLFVTTELNAEPVITADIVLALNTESSIIIDARTSTDIVLHFDAETQLSCSAERTRTTEITIDAVGSLTATTQIITSAIADISSEFTVNVVGNTQKDIDLVAFSDAAVNIVVDVTRDYQAALNSDVDLQITFELNRESGSQQTSEFNLTVISEKIVDSGVLDFQSIATNLTLGRFVNLDMKVYVIPAETRLHRISIETRIHSIDEETRIYDIRSTK